MSPQTSSLMNMGTLTGFGFIFGAACSVYWKIQDHKKVLSASAASNSVTDLTTPILNINPPFTHPVFNSITLNTFDIIPIGVYLALIVGIILILAGTASTLICMPSIQASVKYAVRPTYYHDMDPSFQSFKHRGEVLSNLSGIE